MPKCIMHTFHHQKHKPVMVAFDSACAAMVLIKHLKHFAGCIDGAVELEEEKNRRYPTNEETVLSSCCGDDCIAQVGCGFWEAPATASSSEFPAASSSELQDLQVLHNSALTQRQVLNETTNSESVANSLGTSGRKKKKNPAMFVLSEPGRYVVTKLPADPKTEIDLLKTKFEAPTGDFAMSLHVPPKVSVSFVITGSSEAAADGLTDDHSETNSGIINRSQFNDGGFGDIGMQWHRVQLINSQVVNNHTSINPHIGDGGGTITINGNSFGTGNVA